MFINVINVYRRDKSWFNLKKMDKTRKVIVVLLIVAVVFSAISLVLNLSLVNLQDFFQESFGSGGNNGGNVQLVVEPSGSGASNG